MASTHPPAKLQSQHQDDLKQIHGIGPAMEERLHSAGIFTFAHIAEMSADELASLFSHIPGLTAERITEKGWINQAKELSEKKSGPDATKLADDGQYSAVFSIDLLLDNQNQIRRTHIIHAQSREEINWAGWDQNKLANFILKNASVKPARLQVEVPNVGSEAAGETLETGQRPSLVDIQGDLYLHELEIRNETESDTRWHVNANKPFGVSLQLDLSKTSIPPESSIYYQTLIYAKNLANGRQQLIGEDQGILRLLKPVHLDVNCHELPEGTYRLEACVTVSPEQAKLDPKSSLAAMTEGRIFTIS